MRDNPASTSMCYETYVNGNLNEKQLNFGQLTANCLFAISRESFVVGKRKANVGSANSVIHFHSCCCLFGVGYTEAIVAISPLSHCAVVTTFLCVAFSTAFCSVDLDIGSRGCCVTCPAFPRLLSEIALVGLLIVHRRYLANKDVFFSFLPDANGLLLIC